jgi:putative transposase
LEQVTFIKESHPMDPLAPVIKPELLDELLKLTKDPKALFGAQGVLQQLKGALMERILEAELTEHLGYEPSAAQGRGSGNSRNGHTHKTVTTESGPVDIRVPRDRAGTFEPQVVPKHARRLEGFDEHVLSLYGRGMPMREIQDHLRHLYGTEVSPDLITRVTDAVLEHAREWQARPLEPVYPVLYIDALYTSVRDGGAVTKKAIYVALGIAVSGQRDVLGLWIEPSEGARTWLSVLTELRNRGLQDVLFVCCDGLSGLSQAVNAVFPKATVQTCIVHLIRASLRYVADRDRKHVVAALREAYGADSEASARQAFDAFEQRWGAKYPPIVRLWRSRWDEIVPFLSYPPAIRRILYTTNAVESLNAQLRRVLRPKGQFPNDDAVFKILFLALQRAKLRWKPAPAWKQALTHFAIMFDARLPA